MNLQDEAFHKAIEVLRLNITDRGFSACSLRHDTDAASNYRSVWARDSALTVLWSLPLRDPELTDCAKASIETIFAAQTEGGHLPNYVDIETGNPEYGGVGNIAGVDGAMWMIIAVWRYHQITGDETFVREMFPKLENTMRWLRALDSNNCGLLEVPEASDWMDLFPRAYHVLLDEILWFRANQCFADLCTTLGHDNNRYLFRAKRIRRIINDQFWPTPENLTDPNTYYASTQFSLGRTRYLLAQITPFGFSWRCDVFANVLAFLYGVIDEQRATRISRFLDQICIDKPYPVRVLYPAIQPGQPEWKDYFLVNMLNLPGHYHNGGIWPFVGGLWVRYQACLGRSGAADNSLRQLAKLCQDGVDQEWEFSEWAHAETGKPMGKPFQAWSAASYVAAYLHLQGDEHVMQESHQSWATSLA